MNQDNSFPETEPVYICNQCVSLCEAKTTNIKILSIMYRSKKDKIEIFYQIKCGRCNNLITIITEDISCE